jgi:hypothetical protein
VTAANGIAPPDTEIFVISVRQAPAFTSPPQTTFKAGTFGTFTVQASGYPQSSFSEFAALVRSAGLRGVSPGRMGEVGWCLRCLVLVHEGAPQLGVGLARAREVAAHDG